MSSSVEEDPRAWRRGGDNLYMAGRCISGDFIAHASYRVTGSSVAQGEAVGKAAADLV